MEATTTDLATEGATEDETEDTNEGGILTNAYVVLGLMLFFVFWVMYLVYLYTM